MKIKIPLNKMLYVILCAKTLKLKFIIDIPANN